MDVYHDGQGVLISFGSTLPNLVPPLALGCNHAYDRLDENHDGVGLNG